MIASAAQGTPNSDIERKRLHITPFSEDLLDRYVPTSIHSLASGISFHTVQTAPERPFGYVELPVLEAEKLRKKFNGMTMKGSKIKIEDAKPEKKRKVEADGDDEDEKKARKRAKMERRKKEEGVIPGYELDESRHVKRGWKEDGAKKSKKSKSGKEDASESVDGRKMLFKTVVPPNVAPVEKKKKAKSDAKKETKEEKAVEAKHGKEKRKAVVQEFGKTSKPAVSSNGAPAGKSASRYEDGQGWVDEAGGVVEAERPSKKPRKSKPAEPSNVDVSSSEESSVMDDSSVVSDDESMPDATLEDHDLESAPEEEATLSAQSRVDSSSDEEEATPAKTTPTELPAGEQQDVDADDDGITTPKPQEVHPLEALFKRSAPVPESATKSKPQPIDTSFSFFNSGAADEDQDEDTRQPAYPPQTPHTKADLEWRGQRSAAPTPDTAAIGRKFSFPFGRRGEHEDDDEDEDEDEDEVVAGAGLVDEELPDANGVPVAGGEGAQAEESEFRKWFYDNRGALNRGWKKRRREERKAKRQRENRRLSRRVV